MPAEDPAGARALAVATRRLMDAVVRTRLVDADLAAAAEAVEELADRVGADLSPTMAWPTMAEMRRGYRPYNPIFGELNPYAPPVRWQVLPDLSVEGRVTMSPIHEGPPGAVHGGLVGALLDQLLGQANVAAEVGGMTAELTIRYLRPTPYNVPLLLLARHDHAEGRRSFASGEIYFDDVVTATAVGIFVQPSVDRRTHLASLLDTELDSDPASSNPTGSLGT